MCPTTTTIALTTSTTTTTTITTPITTTITITTTPITDHPESGCGGCPCGGGLGQQSGGCHTTRT